MSPLPSEYLTSERDSFSLVSPEISPSLISEQGVGTDGGTIPTMGRIGSIVEDVDGNHSYIRKDEEEDPRHTTPFKCLHGPHSTVSNLEPVPTASGLIVPTPRSPSDFGLVSPPVHC